MGRFRTGCCGQLFHKECLLKHKQTVGYSPSKPRACPLCRSAAPTGLTPVFKPSTARPGGGGFVNGLALHGEMVRRAATARQAVQRALAGRQEASAPTGQRMVGGLPAPPARSPIGASPGAAYNHLTARSGLGSRLIAAQPVSAPSYPLIMDAAATAAPPVAAAIAEAVAAAAVEPADEPSPVDIA